MCVCFYDMSAWLCDVQVLRSDIERHSLEMKNVDHTGTYLKYFGSKQDTVYVRNRLSSTRLRWKRLLRRVDETSRRLDRALRDAKRVKFVSYYALHLSFGFIHSRHIGLADFVSSENSKSTV